MTAWDCAREYNVEVLQQLFGAATHEASAAMCQWTNSLITLTLDKVLAIPLEDVCAELKLGDEMLTMVVMSLDNEIGGSMVLAFDEENGRQLAASLLGSASESASEWSEMEISALNETGNILGCAYMNAITRLLNYQLIPSIPYFIRDYGASVVEQAVLGQASCDKVLICRTGFHRQAQDANRRQELSWWVLFVPSERLRQAMERAIGVNV